VRASRTKVMKNYNRKLLFPAALSFGLFTGLCFVQAPLAQTPPNAAWPRPVLVPVPGPNAGAAQPLLSLNGGWKTKRDPQGEFWSDTADLSGWTEGQAGGRGRGGFGGGGGVTAFRKNVAIPAEFAGKRVILRFDGVADAAKVWVNGVFVRDHWGSFMAWSCDVTDRVTPGKEASFTLSVDERPDGLAAFVRGGGVQRDIKLFAVPQDYLERVQVDTEFDKQFHDATLKLGLRMAFHHGDRGVVKLTLKDAQGAAVPLTPGQVELSRDHAETSAAVRVANPLHWDAEHPNLYTLETSVVADGQTLQTVSQQIGFRQIEVVGNRMLINGREVKFRGIWGGNDVAQIKDGNFNHTRQKWVTEDFLNQCDRLGVYVQDENPVDFAKYGPESDPKDTYQWMSFISDLIERDHNHPSVVIWGLGNESLSGPNILKTFQYAKAIDPTRPATYTWANRIPVNEEIPYSIYASHYPNFRDPNLNLGGYTVAIWHSPSLILERKPVPVMPVLHDEYAHAPILNQELLARDPNIRNFWGESIYRFWEKMFVTPGALGGDIFGLGSNPTEMYLARKAYSPIRIARDPLANPGAGRPLSVPVKNWFDHTNLHELRIDWGVGGEKGTMSGPAVDPHAAGTLSVPARAWKDGEQLSLKFYQQERMVDEFLLDIGIPKPIQYLAEGPAPTLQEDAKEIVVTGQDFRIVFNKYKGLMTEGSYRGTKVIVDGPFLSLLGAGLATPEWWCDRIGARRDGNEVVVEIAGNYAAFDVRFEVRIDGRGMITTKYTIPRLPANQPAVKTTPWDGTDIGGYREVGVFYVLAGSVDRLTWRRKGLWSVYPEDHIGRNSGLAWRLPQAGATRSWAISETRQGGGTNDFRGTKENIYQASALLKDSQAGLTALSDGHDAVRMEMDPGYKVLPSGIRMYIHNQWNYPDLGLGNYMKDPILIRTGYSNLVRMRLEEVKQ
jgi:hypothetical protein